MTPVPKLSRRLLSVAAVAAVSGLVLAGCAQTSEDKAADKPESGSSSSDPSADTSTLLVGTTDSIVSLDPAGSYDNGSFAVQVQAFPFLLQAPYGSPDVEPSLAETADFTAPQEYTVTIKPDSKWSDGTPITAEDVKFSFDRNIAINDPNGPSSLLWNLEETEVVDDSTVIFHLKDENDQTFPQVLSSPAGVIVSKDVFSADGLTPAADILAGGKFGGQYTITQFDQNNTVTYQINPNYNGTLPAANSAEVQTKYYTDASNLKLDIQQGNIDVAYRSLSATDIADLEKQEGIKVWTGPGGEIRYIVFNLDTQPYGAKAEGADAAKALAVRQAVADIVDRDVISEQVYEGTYTPLYGHVAEGMTGATTELLDLYGDGNGGPDVERAAKRLEDAGVEVPVTISLQYSPDHYGPGSADEYALIKDQLEASGLFSVELQGTEWTQYSKDRSSDVYPSYQLGWFPDYSDADNYLTPFFLRGEDGNNGFLLNHYGSDEVDELIRAQGTEPDAAKRTELIEQIQTPLANDLPTLPILQGSQVAVTRDDITDLVLDPSFKFYYGSVVKD